MKSMVGGKRSSTYCVLDILERILMNTYIDIHMIYDRKIINYRDVIAHLG